MHFNNRCKQLQTPQIEIFRPKNMFRSIFSPPVVQMRPGRQNQFKFIQTFISRFLEFVYKNGISKINISTQIKPLRGINIIEDVPVKLLSCWFAWYCFKYLLEALGQPESSLVQNSHKTTLIKLKMLMKINTFKCNNIVLTLKNIEVIFGSSDEL